MENKNTTFTLDGVEYNFDDISNDAKYLVGQLEGITRDREVLASKADLLNMAERGFLERLHLELKEKEEVEKETGA